MSCYAVDVRNRVIDHNETREVVEMEEIMKGS